MEVDHGNLYPYNHACWINGKDDGGWAATAQEWMDYLAGWLAGCSVCKAEDQGICLADGYYTISYDPAP